jgi:hypothetical protein
LDGWMPARYNHCHRKKLDGWKRRRYARTFSAGQSLLKSLEIN